VQTEYSLGILLKLISGQIYTASLVGKEGYAELYNRLLYLNNIYSKIAILSIFITGTSILIYSFIKSQKELKLFIIFSFIILFFSLVKPMAVSINNYSIWHTLSLPGFGLRYYFFPMLSFIYSVLFLLNNKNFLPAKILGYLIIIIFVWGMHFEFFYKPWINFNYQKQIEQFSSLEKGELLKIKTMPEFWHEIKIYKK
jgi:hypothetical protein